MSLNRRGDAQSAAGSRLAVASIASTLLGLSSAFAQQPTATALSAPKLAACTQSMITGKPWQTLLPWGGGVGTYISCPITIATNGSITPGNCLLQPGFGTAFTQLPSGSLLIDRSCDVTRFDII
jgi:hypothetical protein